MRSPPTAQLSADSMELNETSLVAPEVYLAQWNVLRSTQFMTAKTNGYGYV